MTSIEEKEYDKKIVIKQKNCHLYIYNREDFKKLLHRSDI